MLTDEQKRTARPLPIMIKELRDATRDGSKTMTRRIVANPKASGVDVQDAEWVEKFANANGFTGCWSFKREMNTLHPRYGEHLACNSIAIDTLRCPHGKVGDICYLREPLWKDSRLTYNNPPDEVIYADTPETRMQSDGSLHTQYHPAGGTITPGAVTHGLQHDPHWSKAWTSMTMPRWAARTFVEITDIRVERLQDITNQDAIDEGIGQWQIGLPLRPQEAENCVQAAALALGLLNYWYDKPPKTKQRWLDGGSADAAGVANWLYGGGNFPKTMEHKHVFALLWDSISVKRKGKPHYPWSSNPWTWVVKWELCK